jgi:hypothetical protein
VILGRNIKVGITASSNTSPNPVCSNNFLPNFGRKEESMDRPRERMGVLGSSRRVNRGGIKRFQLWLMIASCQRN